MGTLTNGDILTFLGAMLGAAITVLGSIWVINYQSWKRARRDKANLLSFLAMLEARLQFTRSDEDLREFIASRDVPGLINRCALILEMADLLATPAVAEAADGFQQVYLLHRLRRILRVWSPPFQDYADIPYQDFYLLSEPDAFEEAVSKIVMPAAIIRAAVHLYVAQLTGRNILLEEIATQNPGQSLVWDPDKVFVPSTSGAADK
jgi:hypothetical protein